MLSVAYGARCVSNGPLFVNHLNLIMDRLDRLKELEEASSPLQIGAEHRAALSEAVTAHNERFYQSLETRSVYQPLQEERGDALAVGEEPASIEEALNTLYEHVESTGQNTGSRRFFAYIPSGGLYAGALGSFVASVSNRYAGVREAAPGAARLERNMVRWLADEVGYPASAEGDLTSGGSIAALSAIVAARQAYDVRARDVERTVVYLTRLTHHTFVKALRVAGLHECRLHYVPLDENFRMDVAALEQAIVADNEHGLFPWMISATAGTTDLGTVDPLSELADLAERENLWLHVDAAYGGAFVLCEEGKRRLRGLERTQSMLLDPHKGLFLPAGIGAVLVRERQHLYDAFHARGAYLQDFPAERPELELSPTDFSPELTRPFRALQLWLALKLHGIAPFRAALEEKLLLADYFYDQMQTLDGFTTGPRPDLSVIAFRYLPKRGDANDFNRRLSEIMRMDGRTYLTTTTVDGVFQIRMAILNYNTHRDDVDVALEVIEEKAKELAAR